MTSLTSWVPLSEATTGFAFPDEFLRFHLSSAGPTPLARILWGWARLRRPEGREVPRAPSQSSEGPLGEESPGERLGGPSEPWFPPCPWGAAPSIPLTSHMGWKGRARDTQRCWARRPE